MLRWIEQLILNHFYSYNSSIFGSILLWLSISRFGRYGWRWIQEHIKWRMICIKCCFILGPVYMLRLCNMFVLLRITNVWKQFIDMPFAYHILYKSVVYSYNLLSSSSLLHISALRHFNKMALNSDWIIKVILLIPTGILKFNKDNTFFS